MTKDPERIKKRAAAAAKLGITEDELREKRAADDALHLERKASEAGVPVDRYLTEKRRGRNQVNRAKDAAKRVAKGAATRNAKAATARKASKARKK